MAITNIITNTFTVRIVPIRGAIAAMDMMGAKPRLAMTRQDKPATTSTDAIIQSTCFSQTIPMIFSCFPR